MGGCEAKADASTECGDEGMQVDCWAGDVDNGLAPAILRSRTPSSWTHTQHLYRLMSSKLLYVEPG